MSWLKKNLKSILLVASVVLNVLGGTGIVPPVAAAKVGAAINAVGAAAE